MPQPIYKRVLLKLSGEALIGKANYGIDSEVLQRIAEEIADVSRIGIEIAVVIGGGNIFRGKGLAGQGLDRATGDYMGMLATIINSLAMQDRLEKIDMETRVMSAIRVDQVCEEYIRRRALKHLSCGRVVILAAGTSNPFFTTDTAASLRAAEIGAEVVLKATKVNGVYDCDPVKNQHAVLHEKLSYQDVLSRNLTVMDETAVVMCKENKIPIRVFNITEQNNVLQRILHGEEIGTIVS